MTEPGTRAVPRSTPRRRAVVALLGAAAVVAAPARADDPAIAPPEIAGEFLAEHCLGCHDPASRSGGLDLERLPFALDDPETFARWVRIHDRARDGEMPPPDEPPIEPDDLAAFLQAIAGPLAEADRRRAAEEGRSTLRRLNRTEFENTLRDLLDAPWLRVAELLPEDGTAHHFHKVGTALDVSHVQLLGAIEVAEHALREALASVRQRPTTRRLYTREDPSFVRIMPFRPLNGSPERTTIPLLGTTAQPEVIAGSAPVTVGASDPEAREREAFGVVSSTYQGTLFHFGGFEAPESGRYRLRFKTYSFRAGPNGANAGRDPVWWKPSREVASPSDRAEPVTIYAYNAAAETRRLGAFDAPPEPAVLELEADLERGETIRPDASRLFRSRPGWQGNPLATPDGMPGVAYCWMEVEGPLHDGWPPEPYRALFDDLPFEVRPDGEVEVFPRDPDADARRLLERFVGRAYRGPTSPGDARPFLRIFERASDAGIGFADAMIASYVAVLCSPRFLYLEGGPGSLDDHAIASRLSYFLRDGPPDRTLLDLAGDGRLADPEVLREQADRLLDHPNSARFVAAFLDGWLDLKRIDATSPDAGLYPDYYLDDLLKESALDEARRFFAELVRRDLPARNLVAADFAFVNERLADHYELPPVEGVGLRLVGLPEGSPRGGLLTMASVLKVTANGTTTSPVVRGAWVADRILGEPPPPPPPAIPAIEPDVRGAETIRQQLELHRANPSCASCHARFDPFGMALEQFDVLGGRRDRYRAVDPDVPAEPGIGKNGHLFEFHHALEVDPSGTLLDGDAFRDVDELRRLLLRDERRIARNLARQLIVYATGAPAGFGDRDEVEAILDRAAPADFGVRSLIRAVVRSDLFRAK